jgi:DNA-binding MurR/RpiR family transcriptional regulator
MKIPSNSSRRRYQESDERTGINATGSCLARLRAAVQSGPSTLRKIGRFILKTPFQARNLSIEGLAKACGAGAATVHRLCRDMGYAGYKEFQLDLATALASNGPVALEEFGEGASPGTIVRRVFEYHRLSLGDTERLLDVQVLTAIAKLIQRSRRVFLLGLGDSGVAGRRAADVLFNLGYTPILVTDPYTQIFATENAGSGDVVIGISHTGQTTSIVEGIQAARRRGARTVALTNYPKSPLAVAGEFQLITAFHERHINAAVSSSTAAQLCVLDSLFFILGSWGGSKAKRRANEAESRAQKILRNARLRKRSEET